MPKDKTTPQYRAKAYSHIIQHLVTRKHLENVEREKRVRRERNSLFATVTKLFDFLLHYVLLKYIIQIQNLNNLPGFSTYSALIFGIF